MSSLLYFCVIIAVIVQSGYCLKCYNCLSKYSKECANPSAYSDFKPQTCDMSQINNLAEKTKEIAQQLGNAFGIDVSPAKNDEHIPVVCQKIVTTVGSEEVIIRGCQVPTPRDVSYCESMKGKIKDSVITHCSLCDTDGCNSGHWLQPLSFISMLVPILGLKLWTLFTA